MTGTAAGLGPQVQVCARYGLLGDRPPQNLLSLFQLTAAALPATHLAVILVTEECCWAPVASGWATQVLPTPAGAFTARTVRRPAHASWPAPCQALLGDDAWHWATGAPLTSPDGVTFGLLFAACRGRPRRWNAAHQTQLERSAHLIVQALDHHTAQHRLMQEQQENAALRRRLDRATLTTRTFQAIADLTALPLDGREGLRRAARLTAALIGVDWSGVQRSHAEPETVWPARFRRDTSPLPPDVPGSGPLCTVDGEAGWLLADGQPAALAWVEAPGEDARLLFVRFGRHARWSAADRQVLRDLVWALRHLLAFTAQRSALNGLEGQLQFALRSFPMLLWVTDAAGQLIAAEGSALRDPLANPSVLSVLRGENVAVRPDGAGRPNHADPRRSVTLDGRVYDTHQVTLPDGGQLGVAFDVTDLTESRAAARQAQQYAETLLELTRVLPASGQLRHLGAQALNVLLPALSGSWLVFWEHVPGEGRLRPLVTCGAVPPGVGAAQTRGFSDTDPFAQRLLAGQTVQIHEEHLPPPVVAAGLRAALLIPVQAAGSTFVLAAYQDGRGTWTPPERELLTLAARVLQVSLERHTAMQQLRAAASTDPLTGLGNRRAFEAEIREALASGPVTLVTLDVDGLKTVNDRDGHARGDALLRAVSRALGAVPDSDAYRVGGDEFCLLLRGTRADVLTRVERVLAGLPDNGFPDAGASAGVAYAPQEAPDPEALWQLADERMYRQKASRRPRPGRAPA